MSTKSEIIKLKNKCYKDSNDLSSLQFDPSVSEKKSYEIKEKQNVVFSKYTFYKKLSKAMDTTKEKQQEDEEKNETEFEDFFFCSNCRELFPMDEMGTSELARQDQICKYCMGDGYGR